MKCSTTRRIIDRADNPANLPYEAAGHVEECVPCRQFAGERERLRKLLLEPARVSAPANFEAMVARRLAAGQATRRPFWLATGFYLRAGGAAAALASVILVIQMARVNPSRVPQPAPNDRAAVLDVGAPPPVIPRKDAEVINGTEPPVRPSHWKNRAARALANTEATSLEARDLTEQAGALILVRNSGSEREIAVPMFSVGAQPWLSVSLESRDERGVRTAF